MSPDAPSRRAVGVPPGARIHLLDQYSFSDEAGRLIQNRVAGVSLHYHGRIDDIWQAVEWGEHGIVPIENASGGIVWPHLDRLRRDAVRIVAEANVEVHMHAGGVAGSSLHDVTDVYSHRKGLDQCREFIRRHLPAAVREHDEENTARAAMRVRDRNDPRHVALASRLAFESLQMPLLAEDVADLPPDENITQFLILCCNPENHLPLPEASRHAALLTPRDERGVLSRILQVMANSRVDLTSLHSRSIGRKRYSFYIEMERQGSPDEFRLMAEMLKVNPDVQEVKWLGSWNDSFEN